MESSHWDSAPLVFALVPAVGGLFFKNGSAVLTDAILLIIAAIFLNWSVRVPWDWYHSAQSIEVTSEDDFGAGLGTVVEEDSESETPEKAASTGEDGADAASKGVPGKFSDDTAAKSESVKHGAVVVELRLHELLALASCFLGPIAGAYLLHQIRGQLSRPSEGLVSNYNLTIFLLASEIRPLAHLVKLIQARTLHLQRHLHENPYQTVGTEDKADVVELSKRIEEIEARLATSPSRTDSQKDNAMISQKASAQLTADVRRTLQPDLDALNRAVRRYEKRATLQTMQTEARLQDLESRLQDALALAAAAAQTTKSRNPLSVLLEWLVTLLLLPLQLLWSMVNVPLQIAKIFLRRTQMSLSGQGGKGRKDDKNRSHGRIGGDRLQGRSLRKG